MRPAMPQLGEPQLVNLLERVNEQTKKTTTVKVRSQSTLLFSTQHAVRLHLQMSSATRGCRLTAGGLTLHFVSFCSLTEDAMHWAVMKMMTDLNKLPSNNWSPSNMPLKITPACLLFCQMSLQIHLLGFCPLDTACRGGAVGAGQFECRCTS